MLQPIGPELVRTLPHKQRAGVAADTVPIGEMDPVWRPDILPGAAIRGADRMPKSDVSKNRRARPRTTSARPVAADREQPAAPPGRSSRSVAMRLAEEVDRLELELAAAHTRMAALEARAEIDALTDLVNRRGLERELKRALAYVKRYGTSAVLVYLDLDGFKSVNDRHGHAAGDAVLKAVAMVLTRQVRASDLVARLGGDEFVVLLWNLAEADAQPKARSLEAAVSRMTAAHGDATLSVGASAGNTMLWPLDTPATVLERADRAMYIRKTSRRSAIAADSAGAADPGSCPASTG
jgi:diguanylate cyclase (GGDEF)-like protein